ncbi:PA14 domain-containing protein [Arenibacter sp. F26102]|uniref:PA14 domain-containing protein n=1 Tax=Arenibacter sp. F26102 TaxID=2926416 RepID=UPI001FF2D301|nr:PA14 domain-containing protein [Arenibacter sp. F26102]MCK0146491.1 PA14 domain-containing protein [Arenibacter sp. F26102]
MKHLLVSFFAFWLLMGCNSDKSKLDKERPREVWVFRSVLDERPRMATAALNDNLWVAYDTQTATLYKAWNGGVFFDGAVYTTKHGPQPTSLGYAYFSHNEEWVLWKDGGQITPIIQYKGHRFKDGEVIFKVELRTPEGDIILVEESPRYQRKGDKNGLVRYFTVANPTDYQVGLSTVITSLEDEGDFSTDGTFGEIIKEIITFEDGEFFEIEGTLLLNKTNTELSILFHPGFDKLQRKAIASGSDQDTQKTGIALVAMNDCVACHNETEKTVGPSYMSIAEKYGDDTGTIEKLVGKIRSGGSGVWGQAVMTPHPDLDDNDLEDMVKYILALDDNGNNDSEGNPIKYTLGEKSNPLKFESDMEPKNGTGLVAHLYVKDPNDKDRKYTEAPIQNGVTSSVHVLSAQDFGSHNSDIKIVFQGQITVEKEDSYVFRLISDDGSQLYIDDKLVVDNGGAHAFQAIDGETYLKAGKHTIKIDFEQGGGGAAVSLQWFDKKSNMFTVVPEEVLSYSSKDFIKSEPLPPPPPQEVNKPGDKASLAAVHPSFSLYDMRPDGFEPRVGGMDFKSDSTLVLSTWDADGSVYYIKNYLAKDRNDIEVKRIATGLAEPLGVKVVGNEIYVLQKHELTRLMDHDGDEVIDEYETVSNDWGVSGNFHEFAFGLAFKEGYFYATLATAIMPGGASADPQIKDRGKVAKINPMDGTVEFIASGLRTPNGIGFNEDEEIFVADNQGDWLPASKIVHIKKGEFYGSRSVDFDGTKDLKEKLPVVWLPQDEIGNSPSQPTYLNLGPYKNQLIHGEVTHGGIKRVAYEEVEGQLQGSVFRFSQGIEAGVNRLVWAPDGSLIVGGIGVSGNWGHYGKLKHGLQRLEYNGSSTFEMLRINALSNGFEIELTEPLAKNITLNPEHLEVETWYYLPTPEYGGPKLGKADMKLSRIQLSKDRKKVFVGLNGLKENHMVYFHLNPELKSDSGKSLWTTEAWYTLNKIPKERSVKEKDY